MLRMEKKKIQKKTKLDEFCSEIFGDQKWSVEGDYVKFIGKEGKWKSVKQFKDRSLKNCLFKMTSW